MVSDNGGERFAVSIAWQWQFWLPVSSLESHHDILFVASDDLSLLKVLQLGTGELLLFFRSSIFP